jgi:ATP-dependent exoDNAse (exonuclease V) alpha subunit
LHPFCQRPGDLVGLEDLNNLLGRHQEIETKHHKLWLTSQAVLQRVLHNATFLQTELERESIMRRLSLYVQTPAFDRARRLLDQYNYCIISGIPGIGKTTLAEILIIHLLEGGFELVVATSNIAEALHLLRSERSQTVYYDDFLGRSSLGEKLGKNEDRSLLRLLKEVRSSSSKKLILTTREYILAQAKQTYELLNDRDLDLGRCVVQLEDYTRYDRARILYNHLFFFDVPDAHTSALLADRRYKTIVDHRNFSPRIVRRCPVLC